VSHVRVGSGNTERKNVKERGEVDRGLEGEREAHIGERETKSARYITRELAC
jgi:hypothetical protein